MQWEKLIKISRPRFWVYLFGPFLIGRVAGMHDLSGGNILEALTQYKQWIMLALLLVAADYFLFSANLFIYGINDLSDDDTDKYNDKKGSYEHELQTEERTGLARQIIIFAGTEGILLMVLLVRTQKILFAYEQRRRSILALVIFRATGYLYSSPPVRAKALPFLDGIFNVLYIMPAVIGRMVAGHALEGFSWLGFLGGWLWAMAMHAYSAVPDIEPDTQAGLLTTAVYLGRTKTLMYCGALRAAAALIGYTILGWPMLLVGLVYLVMIGLSFTGDIDALYKRFPMINGVAGFVVFWLIVL